MRSERESAWHEMAKQVAHEIKNPLTPLRLGVQLLNRSYRENDPDFDQKFERFSKSFIEQIESLNHIASEFSNFAKMPDTVLIDLDIIEVIEQAISIYAESKDIKIKLEVNDPGQVIVHADRDQLLRSFNNLIKNAVEAKLKGRTCLISIKVKTQLSGFVSIDIKDNGKGIDMNVRDKIFQPNFTTKSSGTGLGLAFVKQTIETIGGTIRYKTETLVGTTFYILIPLKRHSS
jgi:nitrogen fixation/metabolism regulation signal transduction histidine kinase